MGDPCICCGPNEATIIEVGPLRVGLVDLRKVLTDVSSLGISDGSRLEEELLRRVKVQNYIAPNWEGQYGKALLREYRIFAERRVKSR